MSMTDHLAKLWEMRKEGAISQEEFEREKARLLGVSPVQSKPDLAPGAVPAEFIPSSHNSGGRNTRQVQPEVSGEKLHGGGEPKNIEWPMAFLLLSMPYIAVWFIVRGDYVSWQKNASKIYTLFACFGIFFASVGVNVGDVNHTASSPRAPQPLTSTEQSSARALDEPLRTMAEGVAALRRDECLRDHESIMRCVKFFDSVAEVVAEALEHGNGRQRREAAELGRSAVILQVEMFPRLRDAFGPATRAMTTNSPVAGRTVGEGFHIFEAWGRPFLYAEQREEFNEIMQVSLKPLRFKRAHYSVRKGDRDYDAWPVLAPEDHELADWNGPVWTVVDLP